MRPNPADRAAASPRVAGSGQLVRSTWRGIPRAVWALGFVSLLMDVSSEMIHALLPACLVTVLATSATTVGIIEGIAEATASVTKVFSGALSDGIGRASCSPCWVTDSLR